MWIPPIKNPLFLDEIGEARKEQDKDFRLNVIVGMYDDPQNQKQQPVIVDFAAQGHLAVFGTISSGKSTFMQTLAGALIRKYTAKELNLYMIDFSNKALKCFENAPQTGGVVCEDEPDRLKKLFYMLNKKIAERKKQLEGISYSAYIRSKGKNMPAILVLLDNYNGFREKTDDCYEADMIKLAHDGMAYGIFLAITANNMGSNGLPNRLADSIPTTLALVMNDRYQYSESQMWDSCYKTYCDLKKELEENAKEYEEYPKKLKACIEGYQETEEAIESLSQELPANVLK